MGGNVEKREVFVSREKAGTKEHVVITDVETGEIIDQFWTERRKKPSGRPPKKEYNLYSFYKVYEINWKSLINRMVKRKGLSFNEIGFFVCLFVFLDYESNFLVNPKTKKNLSGREIAEHLGVDHKFANEMLNRLREKGLLAVVATGKGNPNHYILNTNVVFKGNKIRNISEHDRFVGSTLGLPVDVIYEEREIGQHDQEHD